MPYIPRKDRELFDQQIKEIAEEIHSPGELNYVISKIINLILARQGVSYTKLNELVGAMECAKMELYRKVAAKYEDEKEEQNGPL